MTDKAEFIAGHAPANIVGGRRVAHKDDKTADSAVQVASGESNQTMRDFMDNNLSAKMEKVNPTAAVKRTHEKPIPALQHQSMGATRANAVQRNIIPRKDTH